jgi:hypothetical protein
MRRLAHVVLVLALSFSIGLHWACLQSAAWVNMIVTYSSDGGLTQALQKTFDGEHPCSRCMAIQKEQDTEKQNESKSLQQKINLFTEQPERFIASIEVARQDFLSQEAFTRLRTVSPAVPPPRWA